MNNAVPLYCFYNSYNKANEVSHWHCKRNYEQKLLGWTITTVKNVEAALSTRGSRNFEFIHAQKETLPTKCLFDCPILIRDYKDKTLVGKTVKLFDTQVTKLESLPYELNDQQNITEIESFPEDLYASYQYKLSYDGHTEIYPKRIAIFDLGNQ